MKGYPKKLKVMIDGEWYFVFCRNPLKSVPITTPDYKKALPSNAKAYFERYFPGLHFKAECVMPPDEQEKFNARISKVCADAIGKEGE